ncbi:MAG: RagB/SusD family nutrient uptake outer membrane protein [Alistipes sp.]|uniref:RagB/SusD family nutrient uptake outer membrane protein n=1 Tax=Alistipes sp. TaxID=1872444 RepID=UPI0023F4B632|nr:RagB/SusD family nutrient uptake outer membrane protein [Alistipes sp.]MBQ7893953.1 RagB/SusD family nutrient uptake outer membrane protein [Alistipes sp.]
MKIRYIATLLLLAVGTVSCKDWLDVYPRSEITSNKVFENEDGFYSALAGLYIKMADDKLYGFDLTCGYLDLMGGAVYMGAGNMVTYQANNYYADPTYGPMVAALQFPAFNYTRGGIRTEKTDATLETIWTKMYNTITNANLLLQELKTTDVAFETGVKELLTGEALAVRAYLHLDLVRLFQPPYLSEQGRTAKRIPYMETLDALKFVPSSTTDEILDKVDADLAHAAEIMKDNDPISSDKSYHTLMFTTNRQYKLNYYAVKLLQARSFLYRGKDKEAYEAAKEVIDNAAGAGVHFITEAERSRVDSYGTPVDRSCPMENLFAVLTDDLDKNMRDALNMSGTRLGAMARFNSNKWLSATSGLTPGAFFSAESDIRINLWKRTVYPSGMVGKYIRESSAAEDVALYPKQAVTLLKLGEAYLIAAEAAITAVSPSEGLSILRQLQDARKGSIYDTTDGLKEEILLEYRRETLGEGQLFYAYKRRNEPRLTTLFQTPDMAYYFTMDDNKYTPDIPDKEYNAGRTY